MAGDTGLAAVVMALALSTFANPRSDATAAAIVVSVLLVAPLVLRRRAPVAAFAAVMLACAAELLLVDQFLVSSPAWKALFSPATTPCCCGRRCSRP